MPNQLDRLDVGIGVKIVQRYGDFFVLVGNDGLVIVRVAAELYGICMLQSRNFRAGTQIAVCVDKFKRCHLAELDLERTHDRTYLLDFEFGVSGRGMQLLYIENQTVGYRVCGVEILHTAFMTFHFTFIQQFGEHIVPLTEVGVGSFVKSKAL